MSTAIYGWHWKLIDGLSMVWMKFRPSESDAFELECQNDIHCT